jgi:hypothetical protein
MFRAVSNVYPVRSQRAAHEQGGAPGTGLARTAVIPMSRETLVPLILAGLFTLGCVGIHRARRHPDAVTLGLVLLLGLLATVYVGQHVALDARHPSWQHEASHPLVPLPAHPMM